MAQPQEPVEPLGPDQSLEDDLATLELEQEPEEPQEPALATKAGARSSPSTSHIPQGPGSCSSEVAASPHHQGP